jgi:hypothetical protein
MKELKTSFRQNGLLYTQLKRNEVVALYGVGGTYSDNISHYEVCKIYIRNDKYGIRKALPTNEQFGKDLSSHFNNYNAALSYFDELTSHYILLQRGSKVVKGVEEDIKLAA